MRRQKQKEKGFVNKSHFYNWVDGHMHGVENESYL